MESGTTSRGLCKAMQTHRRNDPKRQASVRFVAEVCKLRSRRKRSGTGSVRQYVRFALRALWTPVRRNKRPHDGTMRTGSRVANVEHGVRGSVLRSPLFTTRRNAASRVSCDDDERAHPFASTGMHASRLRISHVVRTALRTHCIGRWTTSHHESSLSFFSLRCIRLPVFFLHFLRKPTCRTLPCLRLTSSSVRFHDW